MKPFVTETDTALVIVIPKGDYKASHEFGETDFYSWRGEKHPIPDVVLEMAKLWEDGLTGHQISKKLHGSPYHDVITQVSGLRAALPAMFPYRRADANSRINAQSNGSRQ